MAAATGRTSAVGRRPVAPAASTLSRQTGRPVVAGDFSEKICVGGAPVVVGGPSAAGHLRGSLVVAAGSTTGKGGLLEGPPGVEGGYVKRSRVAGPLVDEVGTTDGGSRRRLEGDDRRRRRHVGAHVGRQDRRGRRQIRCGGGEDGREADVVPEGCRRP